MRIKFGSIVVDGRGKVGGHFASKAQGSNFLATNTFSHSSKSIKSADSRASFASAASAWRTITLRDYRQWAEFASSLKTTNVFGDPIVLSPFAVFSKFNMRRKLYFDNTSTEVPGYRPSFENAADPSVFIENNVPTARINGSGLTGNKIVFFATAPSNYYFKPGSRKYIAMNSSLFASTFGQVYIIGYNATFPYFTANQWVGYKVFIVSPDGWISFIWEGVSFMEF